MIFLLFLKNKTKHMKNIFFSLISFLSMAQITRVEPPFWYADMHHNNVQIMFYGKDISSNDVKVSDGVKILNIKKTENPNYLFITIDTKKITPKNLIFTFEKNKVKFTQAYQIKKRKENSRMRKSFSSEDVIYLLMPDRFANGNTNNDSHESVTEKLDRNNPGGRHGGDIKGIINHLDYLQELGVTAIWSTPLCEDNDEEYSYHTYGQSDVYKIDPRYGTNEEYVNLSTELKKRNMKLIKDVVPNHWGHKHWMMNDMPCNDWFHQFPGFKQTNYRMTTQFDPNTSEYDAKLCTDGWFVKSMPDLNQSNPLVMNYLIQNTIWWIEYADLDGLRVDTYSYTDKNNIARWTKAITDEYPNLNITGEAWYHNSAHIAYWQKDSKIAAIQNYNSHLPNVMDFTLHNAFSSQVFNEDTANWNQGIIKIYENFVNDFMYPNINNVLIFMENHDTHRFNHLNSDVRKYYMAIGILATIRGIPQVYYGSEIGMKGNKDKGDADIRQDFPGGWQGDAQNAFTEKGRTENQNQYFNFTKKVFNWRKNKAVIHTGKTTHYVPENNVYVYFRHNDNETIMVVVNNQNTEQTIDLERFKENIKSFTKGKNIINDAEISFEKSIKLEPKSIQILELK